VSSDHSFQKNTIYATLALTLIFTIPDRWYWRDTKGKEVRRNARKKIHFSKCFFLYIFLYGFYISVRSITSSSLISPSKKVQLVAAVEWETLKEIENTRKEKRAGVEWSRRFVGLHKNLSVPLGGWM
jgi:hypothetical protein